MSAIDALIVGGGPAGAATALLLSRLGLKVMLVDRSDKGRAPVGETLPPAIKPLLAELGLLERVGSSGYLPAVGVDAAWGEERLRSHSFLTNPHGDGWHVDRPHFDAVLLEMAESSGVLVQRKCTVRSLTSVGNGWRVSLVLGRRVEHVYPKWTIDATGRSASLGRLLGARRARLDDLVAVVGVTSARTPALATTVVESVPGGWWYASPRPPNEIVRVFVTTARLWKIRDLPPRAAWEQGLHSTNHVRHYGGDEPLTSLRVLPSESGVLGICGGPGWLVVGDAAFSRDPLSGGGVYEAIRFAFRAASTVARSLGGDSSAIADYENEVQQAFSHYLVRRRDYYALEQRFRSAPFWQNLHASTRAACNKVEWANA